jgi:predicted transcriptional regulator
MARPTSPTLTEAELRLMKVLWARGPSTTTEVVATLAAAEVELAESTVRTILGILREKGYVEATARGRARLYRVMVSRGEARRSALRHLVSRFFDDSREELVLNLLADEEVDDAELARLRKLIQEAE